MRPLCPLRQSVWDWAGTCSWVAARRKPADGASPRCWPMPSRPWSAPSIWTPGSIPLESSWLARCGPPSRPKGIASAGPPTSRSCKSFCRNVAGLRRGIASCVKQAPIIRKSFWWRSASRAGWRPPAPAPTRKNPSSRPPNRRWNSSAACRPGSDMSEETVPAATVAETEMTTAGAAARGRTSLREYAESLLVTVLLAIFGTTFVVQAFKIPSQSMEPTLLVGDHLLVNKFVFGGRGHWYDAVLPYRDVRRGDVIVFKFPFQDHPHYVKRVVGMPGDRVKIADQKVYVNGQRLDEPYAYHDPIAPYDPFLYNFPPASPDELLSNMQPEWASEISSHVA